MATSQITKEERIMPYGDHTSSAALWWKVIFLLPIWGFIPAAIIGFIASKMGNAATEVGYFFVLFLGIAYFLEDVLKRKLKITDGVMYFGYKKLALNKLRSVGVAYEDDKIIPRDMILTFQDGYIFPLELSRIDAKDIQYIVKTIDSKFPHCTIDSTLRTLARCQELNPRLRSAVTDIVEVPYHTHRVIVESAQGFISTFKSWSRLGPLLVWVACSIVWIPAVYCIFKIVSFANQFKGTSLAEQAVPMLSKVYDVIGKGIGTGSETFANIASTPVVGIMAACVTLYLLVNLIRKLGQPSLLVLDDTGIRLFLAFKMLRTQVGFIPWNDISSVQLMRPSEDTHPDRWKIQLQRSSNNTKTTLEYSAIDPRGRTELYERMRHYAPMCAIDPELAEACMPKQHASYTELWLQSLSGSPKRDNLDPLEPGHVLNEGRYEILSKIGVGGQGAAYLSRENSIVDKQHCQEVVLKETIFPIFVDDSIRRESLERFEHEARTLNALNHDHIVKLSDYFVEDHRGYLVLEHIQGSNLRDTANKNPMQERDVLGLALQMCDMLEYLHGKNVIHRDFTPDNLILERSGTLKLIDFNVAQTQNTGMTGTVVGKHAYVPPEQFRGKPVPASDVYAMGCSLFYLLSGHDPEPITQSAIEKERAGVSEALSIIIKKCTHMKADARYQDITEIRADLQAALQALPEDSTASSGVNGSDESMTLDELEQKFAEQSEEWSDGILKTSVRVPEKEEA